METPVLSRCGHLFEKTIVAQTALCPIHQTPLNLRDCIPLSELKKEIDDWKASQAIGQEKAIIEPHNEGEVNRELKSLQKKLKDHPSSLRLMEKVAKCLAELGRFEEALSLWDKIISKLEKSNAPLLDRAHALNKKGIMLQNLGKYEEALQCHFQSLSIKRSLPNISPEKLCIPVSLNNLGNCFNYQERLGTALNYFKEALRETIRIYGSDHPNVLRPLNNTANQLMILGKHQEAVELSRAALSIAKKHPENFRFEIPRIMNNLGRCERIFGNFETSLQLHQKALELAQKLYGKYHLDISYSWHHIGCCFQVMGEYKKAKEAFETALEVKRNCPEGHGGGFIPILNDLGVTLSSLGKPTEALALHEQASFISLSQYQQTGTNANQIKALIQSSFCIMQSGKYHLAITIIQKAVKIIEDKFKNPHPDYFEALNQLGHCFYALGKYQEALEQYEKAYGILLQLFESNHHLASQSLSGIGNCLASQGLHLEGSEKHRQALEIRIETLGKAHPLTASSMVNLASCLSGLERYEEAKDLYEKALNIRRDHLGKEHPDTLICSSFLTTCQALLQGKSAIPEDHETPLTEVEFDGLIRYARNYLYSQPPSTLKFVKNPTGFVRIQLPIPSEFKGRLEALRINYWPLNFKVDVVEAQHTHPRYFESKLLSGGYEHSLFEVSDRGSPFRAHRMFKNSAGERSILYLGPQFLQPLRTEKKEAGNTVRFPRALIHQVVETIPGTLSINCVFKREETPWFDVFVSTDSFVDPQAEREVLEDSQRDALVQEILERLQPKPKD